MTAQTTDNGLMNHSEIGEQGYTYSGENGDTEAQIVQHVPSGESYIAIVCSVWQELGEGQNDECVGLTIAALYGPLHHTERDAIVADRETAEDYLFNQSRDEARLDAGWASGQEWGWKEELRLRDAGQFA